MMKSDSIELKKMLEVLREKSIMIIFILVIFTLLGYVYSYYYVIPEYKAVETLVLIPNNASEEQKITNNDLALNSGLISTYSNMAKQPNVLRKVIDNLKLDMTEKELLSKLSVNVVTNTYVIDIIVKSTDAQQATDIAKELSNVFLEEIKAIYKLKNIGVIDEAKIPTQPYNINHVKDIMIFFGMGGIISGIVILIMMLLDNTIKTDKDIHDYVELATLGEIPMTINSKEEIVSKENAKSYITECINTIRTNILYMNSAKNAKTILITSCQPQEGKSWTSANIAASFAEANKKVLIIDADLRKGRLNRIFNIDNTKGLSNYLYFMTGDTETDLELAKEYIKETEIANLHILPNGSVPPNPAELLASNNMKKLLSVFKNIYDIIIVDSPPCKLVTDSVILSTMVDAAILVASSEYTKIKDLIEAKKSIQLVDGNLIGVVLNKIKIEGKTYSKNYYYGNDDSDNRDEIKPKEIITVKNIIENAIQRVELMEEVYQEEEKELEKTEIKEVIKNDKEVINYDDEQNKYLDKMIEVISDVKVELNKNQNANMNRIMNTEKEMTNISEFINSKIEEIRESNNEEIENIKQQGELAREELNTNLGKIYGEIIKIKQNNKQLVFELQDTNYADKDKLTMEQVHNIVRQEVQNMDYTKQFNKLEKILLNLSESYLDLSNKINKLKEEEKQSTINNENVVNIERFRKEYKS